VLDLVVISLLHSLPRRRDSREGLHVR